jgi:carboxyl-terminal processing protease
MRSLDPYCEYFSKKDYEDFHSKTISGKFFGVGIQVEVDPQTGYLNVVTPIEDSPAFAADILPGDLLVKVNNEDIKGQELTEVVGKIKGDEGTNVTLTFARKNKGMFDIVLTRAKITVTAVKPKMLDERLGYIRVTDFTEMLGQFDKAVADLKGKGMKGLVVDLRFNGGGLLESAVEMSDRFLPKGTLIVSTKGRQRYDNREIKAEDDSADVDGSVPVVVLVNGGTASASEIVAGCLRDHARAVLVGARTYGKGSVQTPLTLSDGSRVKLTTARYYTPNGTSVHREEGKKEYGLDPDFLVEMTVDEYLTVREFWRQEGVLKGDPTAKPKPPKDLQLEAGVEVLNAKLEGREAKVQRRDLTAQKKPETAPEPPK